MKRAESIEGGKEFMLNLKRYHLVSKTSVTLFISGFFLYGNRQIFLLSYISAYIFVIIRAIGTPSKIRLKLLMAVSYSLFLTLLISFNNTMDFSDQDTLRFIFNKLFSVAGVVAPFVIERFFIVNKYSYFYMPSLQDISSFSFNEVKHNKEKIISAFDNVKKLGKRVSVENIEEIITDLPRHNSFRYINNGTLTEDYFDAAYATLDDPRVYIIISNTGSSASELISVFTRKQYNHASISFDLDLKTIISYNGGEKAYPPGLNREMIEYFNKKGDSSIIVYSLNADESQKKKIIDKIKEINAEGSAYNIMGLIFKYSHRANIMFCSQFVYKMLKYAGLQYFEKPEGKVTPADLVELDYHRKLNYVYEIKFN
ncbi:MAG: hypothetical protein LBV08_06140 [Clostridiales bacterium]|jgi:hypothetical protein|nr:hypothetical protein [Clostridiales bacterium]